MLKMSNVKLIFEYSKLNKFFNKINYCKKFNFKILKNFKNHKSCTYLYLNFKKMILEMRRFNQFVK